MIKYSKIVAELTTRMSAKRRTADKWHDAQSPAFRSSKNLVLYVILLRQCFARLSLRTLELLTTQKIK